jgi:hypothetical protein
VLIKGDLNIGILPGFYNSIFVMRDFSTAEEEKCYEVKEGLVNKSNTLKIRGNINETIFNTYFDNNNYGYYKLIPHSYG